MFPVKRKEVAELNSKLWRGEASTRTPWLPRRTDRSDTPVVGELGGGDEVAFDRGSGQGEAVVAALPQGLIGQTGC